MKRLVTFCTSLLAAAASFAAPLEKTDLKFGFIKLTDCAPLVIAKEKGFFQDEGLSVEVVAQPNWKTLLDNVINGNLDGAHMLSGQPIAATIGIGTQAHVVTAFTMDLNGNGITGGYAVFGRVIEGMDVVDAIAKVQTSSKGYHDDVPVEPIVIEDAVRIDE